MVSFSQKGNFKKIDSYLEKLLEFADLGFLDKYGKEGVEALKEATPVETGETRDSWFYEITRNDGIVALEFHNKHVEKGYNIAVILQYGHGTRTGGWVEGQDYINPALKPIFDEILNKALKEVKG